MRTMRRNKRTIYLCTNYLTDKGLVRYNEPIELKVNYKSVKTASDYLIMGSSETDKTTIKCDKKMFVNGEWRNTIDIFHKGDRVYIGVEPPEEHDVLCKTADYEVDIEPFTGTTINQTEIILVKLSGK